MTRVRKATLLILALAVSIAQGTTSSAQESTQKTPAAKPKTQKRKTRPVNRAFLPPEVKEGLPHVLLIGDSISIGYTLGVRKELEGTANVWRPTTNCGPTTKGVEELNAWLGDRKWDVIHFNFGLHDLKYMGPQGQNLADPKAAKSHQQVSIDDYEKNIRTQSRRSSRNQPRWSSGVKRHRYRKVRRAEFPVIQKNTTMRRRERSQVWAASKPIRCLNLRPASQNFNCRPMCITNPMGLRNSPNTLPN